MKNKCVCCKGEDVVCLLDLGEQPPSNRYQVLPNTSCEHHPLRFGVCTKCGLAQLIDPMPVSICRSRFPWITYNEPESHLDDLVDRIENFITSKTQAFVLGISYKDDSMLLRCQQKGIKRTHRLSRSKDLGIAEPLASIETIQSRLNLAMADELATKYGQADVLVFRHILEHAHNPVLFIQACSRLVRSGGLLIFEVPNCRKIFDGNDHCFIWEEHITYFTEVTLKCFLMQAGFRTVDIIVYPGPMEDSLVAVAVNDIDLGLFVDVIPNKNEILRVRNFADSFLSRKAVIQSILDDQLKKGYRMTLFGAGHLATKFVNFYQLKSKFLAVIDDNPDKQDFFLPGSALPIINSSILNTDQINLCLLALSPESDAKVRKTNTSYLAHGGIFRSIFSASALSIDKIQTYDPA